MLLYKIFRLFLYPLLNWILPFLIPFCKKRILFEKQNLQKNYVGKADIAFQFSSVGELEQVYSILEMLLNEGSQVELCFTSPSVEDQCEKLRQQFPENLRLFRYPILTYNPLSKKSNPASFLTASKICLVRYDFFPEILALGSQRNLVLFAATSKSLKASSLVKRLYYKWCYSQFIFLYPSLHSEYLELKEMGYLNIASIDWRIKRIEGRIELFDQTLQQKFYAYPFFQKLMKHYPKENRLILGSAWEKDLTLLSTELNNNHLVVIVPHDLKINLGKNGPFYFLSNEMTQKEWADFLIAFENTPKPIILNISGILCELYSCFSHAYVGGGIDKSVHSLFEPFFSGCHVYCGSKVERSTEYDFIVQNSPQSILIVTELSLKTLNHSKISEKLMPIDWAKEYLHFKNLCR